MKPFAYKTDLFFDLDHTLWDFEKNSALAFETIFQKHQLNISLSEFLEVYVPVNLKYWKLFREEKISQQDLRYYRLKEVFDGIAYKASDTLIHLLAEEYIVYLPTFNYLYDGAIEILDYLLPKYKLHIITNGFQSVQAGKLRNANIASYFNTVTNSEMAGVKKPNPKIFDFALQNANTTLTQSIMIGDSLEADIQGAQNFGMDAIFFNEFKVTAQGIPQIHTLEELKLFF